MAVQQENSQPQSVEACTAEELRTIIRNLRRGTKGQKHREFERRAWCSVLPAALLEPDGFKKIERHTTVEGIDISENGCALGINRYVAKDTIIRLQLPLPNTPVVEGQVRYCELIAGRKHRIGVQFMRMHHAPR